MISISFSVEDISESFFSAIIFEAFTSGLTFTFSKLLRAFMHSFNGTSSWFFDTSFWTAFSYASLSSTASSESFNSLIKSLNIVTLFALLITSLILLPIELLELHLKLINNQKTNAFFD